MKKLILNFVLAIYLIIPTNILAYEETRDVKDFTGISFSIAGELFITQGNSYSVIIDGPEEAVKRIETLLKGNDLEIKAKDKNDQKNLNEVTVRITIPSLEELSLAGSGDVYVNNAFKADNLEMAVAGSGDIKFENLSAGDIEMAIAGSGDIEIHGRCNGNAEMAIAGSGDINAVDFEAQCIEVAITGSGSAKVFAADELETSIIGSGSVHYKGTPRVDASSIGSGRTKPLR